MRCVLPIGVLLFAGLIAAAGEASHADIIKGMIAAVEQMTAVLSTVKDADSAKAAEADLKKAADKFIELRKLAETTKPPASKKDREELIKEYAGKLEEAQKKLFIQIVRVRQVDGGRDLLKVLSPVLDPKKKSP